MVDTSGDTPGGNNGSPDSGGGGEREPRDIAAQAMIDAFGGIRPMATKLGIPVSTVQGWKQRDTIPGARVGLVRSAAAEHGITLPAATPPTSAPPAGVASAPSAAGAASASPAAAPQSASSSAPTSSEVRESTGTGPRPEPAKAAAPEPPAEPPASPGATGPRPGGRPRPGIRFSPPEDFETEQAADDDAPSEPARPSGQAAPPSAPARGAAPPQPPPAPPAAPAGSGSARGAVVLAVVALAVAILWPLAFNAWLGADAGDGDAGGGGAGLDALAERVAALEASAGGDGAADLQAEIDQLRQTLDSLPTAGNTDDAAVAALAERVGALEQSLAAGGTGDGSVPADVTQALDALQRALDGLGDAVSGLEGRVATIESELDRIESTDQGDAVAALRDTVSGLEASLADVRDTLDGVAASTEAARADLLATVQSRLEAQAEALEGRIAALAGRDDVAAQHQAFLIALGQLSARMRTAQPFADELAALRAVAVADESLAPEVSAAVGDGFTAVEAAADSGLPTLAALQASFDETRRAVLATADAPAEDMLDEIWSELGSVVTVQRVDGVGAGSVDAILATAERALVAGDLAGAVEAMAGLEAHGAGYAEAAAGWLAEARARLAADAAIEKVYDAAMASFRPEATPAGATAGDGDTATVPDGGGEADPAVAPEDAADAPASD